MKKRFKKALFAFFKDEILNAVMRVENSEHQTHVQFISKTLEFKELKVEIATMDRQSMNPRAYEDSLREARHVLIDEALKYIQVDESSVFDEDIYNERRIKCSLFIGIKQWEK